MIKSVPLKELDELINLYRKDGNKGIQSFFISKAIEELEDRFKNEGLPD
jgi:hypothetical protein